MTNKKRNAKGRRKDANYAPDGERCSNCKHFKPRVYGQPAFGTLPETRYKPDWCELHQFVVKNKAICDDWESKLGETK